MKPASDDDVRRKARVLFGDAADEALRILEGVPADWGPERLKLSALRLSEGRMDKLREYVQAARGDPRDVLSWAMSPELFALGFGAGAERQKQAAARDEASWEAWLAADAPIDAAAVRADRRRVAEAQFEDLRKSLQGRLVAPMGPPELDRIRDEILAAAQTLLRDGRLDATVTTRLQGLVGDGVTPGPDMDARLRLFLLVTSVLSAAARADEAAR